MKKEMASTGQLRTDEYGDGEDNQSTYRRGGDGKAAGVRPVIRLRADE